MSEHESRLGTRLLIGGIAGVVGAVAVAEAARYLRRRASEAGTRPMTPREIVESGETDAAAGAGEKAKAADLLYGAAMGAILSAAHPNPSKRTGAVAGAALWLAGFMGWIPPLGPTKPAADEPPRRKLRAFGGHFLWGVATAASIRMLAKARRRRPPRA